MFSLKSFCVAVVCFLMLAFAAQSKAWYPSSGLGQYYPPYNPYSASMTPWQGGMYGSPGRQGVYGYNGPWGNMNGGINPDGSFWVNIRFGGSYQDLQTMITVMQMSGALQMRY